MSDFVTIGESFAKVLSRPGGISSSGTPTRNDRAWSFGFTGEILWFIFSAREANLYTVEPENRIQIPVVHSSSLGHNEPTSLASPRVFDPSEGHEKLSEVDEFQARHFALIPCGPF